LIKNETLRYFIGGNFKTLKFKNENESTVYHATEKSDAIATCKELTVIPVYRVYSLQKKKIGKGVRVNFIINSFLQIIFAIWQVPAFLSRK
jgi:hypothetical protein